MQPTGIQKMVACPAKNPPDGILQVEWTHILVDGIWNWNVLPDMKHHITAVVVVLHQRCHDVKHSQGYKG